MPEDAGRGAPQRRVLALRGGVQGVGFRPWAARRARELGLAARIRNAGSEARVVLEGSEESLVRFQEILRLDPPPGLRLERIEERCEAAHGLRGIRIEASLRGGDGPTRVPPDAPPCRACLAELFDPRDRRYRYAFTHCADCGPRASVLRALPYDRARTTLADFPPCARCRAEYADPDDRRHHAQTLACPDCGPRLVARAPRGPALPGDPVERAASVLHAGGCVALKGYGGFHLAVDATQADAVARLRKRKGRPVKPFAVLVADAAAAHALARLGPADAALLAGPERAVVVAPVREAGRRSLGLAAGVAPGSADLGLLLPTTPLHWLLLFAPGRRPERHGARFAALVLTSANPSGEPTLHADDDADAALAGIADLVVGHDRAVARPSDDPVFRSTERGPVPLRLSRGTAPRVVALPAALAGVPALVAVGGDLASAPAVVAGGEVHVAEHVGDLARLAAADALEDRVRDLCRLLGVTPAAAAHDLHPDYTGTRLARELAPRTLAVQHHHAHAAACLVENGHSGPALALVLDGLGLGDDGEAWGGELLHVDLVGCRRLAWLERVPLPGGDAAARSPWRMAAAWLARAFPEGPPRLPWHARRPPDGLRRVQSRLAPGRSGYTSSCGRLFDAVASLLDVCDEATHESEAPMALEALASGAAETLPAPPAPPGCMDGGEIPLRDLVRWLVAAHAAGAPRPALARAFHEGLARRLAETTLRRARAHAVRDVALSGGCFQNRLLLTAVAARLEAGGCAPLLHRRLPPGDGGLALGQAAVAAARLVG